MRGRAAGPGSRPPFGSALDQGIARVAARQHGAFTLEQARALGATAALIRRRLGSGRWEWLHRGIYRLAGVPPSGLGSLMAACLAAGAGAIASHRSATASGPPQQDDWPGGRPVTARPVRGRDCR